MGSCKIRPNGTMRKELASPATKPRHLSYPLFWEVSRKPIRGEESPIRNLRCRDCSFRMFLERFFVRRFTSKSLFGNALVIIDGFVQYFCCLAAVNSLDSFACFANKRSHAV